MASDIGELVESCLTWQMEKSDYMLRKGSLQFLTIPRVKWQEASVGFITDLPSIRDAEDSTMIIVDCATKMVHLILCRKNTTAGEATCLYGQHVVKQYRVPRVIHIDRDA